VTVSIAHARTGRRLLMQYLIDCPGCRKQGAAHVDRGPAGNRVLVRFVCPDACPVAVDDVLVGLPADEVPLTA
jgi:hypothetical protein